MNLQDLHHIPTLVRWVKVLCVLVTLWVLCTTATCASLLWAQPTIRHYDTIKVERVEMLPGAGRMLAYIFTASAEVREERAACLYGDVDGKVITIEVATWKTVFFADSTSIVQWEECPRESRDAPLGQYLGFAHTHIVGHYYSQVRFSFSNADIMTFWKDRDAVLQLIVWNLTDQGLFLTYMLRDGRTGVWKYAPKETVTQQVTR